MGDSAPENRSCCEIFLESKRRIKISATGTDPVRIDSPWGHKFGSYIYQGILRHHTGCSELWYNLPMSFENQSKKISFPSFALEIKKMIDADQTMRERQLVEEDYWDEELDEKNTARMKEIVLEIGWPTASKVGKQRAHDAWLLIQHSDHDIEFQEQCLELMKNAPATEVEKINIAFLEDRIRVNQGRGQLYGTQFIQKDGAHIPQLIEDEQGVDIRRAEMGMGTLSERIDEMYKKYPFTKKE